MYTFFLAVHNILRWIALILAIIVLVRAYWGWFGGREWTSTDRRVGSFYSISLDVQILLGLLLYFVFSPITKAALSNFGGVMSNPDLRFFALEHVFFMILAVILAHVGVITARRAEEDVVKYRRTAIWISLSFITLLLGMPWFRPLLPGIG
jgi:hypothetical protein